MAIKSLVDVEAFQNINTITDTPPDITVISQGSMFLWLLTSIVLLLVIIEPICKMIVAFIIRTVVLWVLLVVSPLAWIGFAIPEARNSTWTKYWTQLGTMALMPAHVAIYFVIGIVLR